ncbi:MAG: cytochrome c [Gammaproteobacteria bacterium]|nr:cytochrome c [Gammaproteobacteria bacterium]MBT8436855.1 cytochrome c [Gammaproteobacteria bacterium]
MHLCKYGIVSLLCFASFNVAATERWFNQDIVDYGDSLFQQNCAVCHGVNAEGTKEWKKTDANGNYPPPPLDGSAHAWHHSIAQLARSIKEGGIKLGGVMPAFGDELSNQEVLALIAFFQSKWPDEVYNVWHEHHMQ